MKKRLVAGLAAAAMLGMANPYLRTIAPQYSKRKPQNEITEMDSWHIEQAETKRKRRRQRNLRLVTS